MEKRPDSLIFDLDGTLWDAVDSYVWIWNEAFRQLGIERSFTREQLISMMGKQPDEIINECLDGDTATDVKKVYNTVFGLQEKAMPLLGGRLYEGVREGLESLSQKYRLFILSNCESYGIDQFLDFTKLHDYFTDSISFGETRMPKAINLQLLKARHQLEAPVYVGDTEGDHRQTKAAGMPFAFVSYGFGKTENQDYEFTSFKQLCDYFIAL